MNPPEHLPLIKGEIADYYYDPAGILYSYSKNIKRTVENIAGNVALVKQITGNRKVPLLIYLTKSPVPDKTTRQFSGEQVPQIYSAMAMVSKPGLSALIMKLVFAVGRPPIPMKSFTNDADARAWLLDYV